MKIGDTAPDFELLNQDKNKVKLSDYRGKKNVMLLFYPMDFSPICTEEHCTFGPAYDKLNGPNAETVVFGVSTDSPFCHAAFRKQFNIPYDLLADVNRKASKAYDLFMGEEPYNCSKRGTVVIDRSGKISFWQEQPTKEPRTLDMLEKAAMVEDLLEQRANEGGAAHA